MTAAERLVQLSGLSGVSAATHLLAIGMGITTGAALLDYSGLESATTAEHLLYDAVTENVQVSVSGVSLQVLRGTLRPTVYRDIIEYDVRLFDGLKSNRDQRAVQTTVRGLERGMWGRVLAKCEYVPYTYFAASDPMTLRIGYGRPIVGTEEEEEAALSMDCESVWLNNKLSEIYRRVVAANPGAELHEALTSTLYYYQVEYQK